MIKSWLIGRPFCHQDELFFAIDMLIPAPLVIGSGNVLHLRGWCFHSRQRIKLLEVVANGAPFPVNARNFARPDVWKHYYPDPVCRGYSYYCGFLVTVPLSTSLASEQVKLELQATLNDGSRERRLIANIPVQSQVTSNAPQRDFRSPQADHNPLVVICMATYRPPPELLRRQIRSIIEQSYSNWCCLISDDSSPAESFSEIKDIVGNDERFILLPPTIERLGFYYNFERCLSCIPKGADYVALADQDDYWYPRKIETLLSQFGKNTTLAFSDMRLVDENGNEISNTYWTMRRSNHTDLAALLLANTVSGAGLIFRSDLLDHILPFPPRVGELFHDHWIGSVALAKGEIAYVPQPLYDYTRHMANVTSYHSRPKGALPKRTFRLVTSLFTRKGRYHARFVYYDLILRAEVITEALTLRCAPYLTPRNKLVLHRLREIETSLATSRWLLWRGLKDWHKMSVTDGAEYELLSGLLWKRFIDLRAIFRRSMPVLKRWRRG